MPELDWNLKEWGSKENWEKFSGGELWSQGWGGSFAQWYGLIFPRIANFLPCETMLEIAPGYGRWTQYIINYCKNFYAVDISQECVDICSNKWGNRGKFYKTDGKSLPFDCEFDFVFSFDSLVHVEYEIIKEYIGKIIKLLKNDGFAFIHHSNLFEYRKKMPSKTHARAPSVSASHIEKLVDKCGGKVVIQEKVNWGTSELIDCFSLFTKGKSNKYETKYLENNALMDNASYIRNYLAPYSITK
ncbi:class I SAM-dependent methyltransferase [Desulfonatronum lacustre]|uniref:class I SAM-dependent methyltransferase n=1 Tax=Desulfonatronum lacustre TaxID=66849 RepID=UPI0009FEDA3B|nr:class I SAM-dependent methyltransferase [Desulfonatronum lacustre]